MSFTMAANVIARQPPENTDRLMPTTHANRNNYKNENPNNNINNNNY